jgi:L-ribulose-5-phosphate 3-epimerase
VDDRVGFMQGRLSPVVGDRIQAFPRFSWREEFAIAERHGFRLMEWTLDQDGLYENPLLTPAGQVEIRALCRAHGLSIPSLTGDCFMQAPFWKAAGVRRDGLERDFLAVADASAAVGISMIVVPLVDNGRLDTAAHEDTLVTILQHHAAFLTGRHLRVLFESDFNPLQLRTFIGRLDPELFGINYDTGNSAALGFDPSDELAAYGHRIVNVHIKDRVLGGATVPLGAGCADFDTVFGHLARIGYPGNFILQTARAADGDHAGVLCRYREMAAGILDRHGA